jgi:Na+/proline symporter
MHWFDWLITITPMIPILWMAIYSRKYVRGVADYLAAGRVAGRYVLTNGGMMMGASALGVVAGVEVCYQTGYAVGFWGAIVTPIGLFLGLLGYCSYRFRETRSLSFGQFIEMRYSRSLRVIASFIRTTSEIAANAIAPAIVANFFIYYLGLPRALRLWGGVEVPVFALLVGIFLTMCVIIMWTGGRVGLLITDALQALLSYPVFCVIVAYICLTYDWDAVIAPTLLDRVPGESFLNPYNIASLRDFNVFATVVGICSGILNRAVWIGNDASTCARSAHEGKMAGVMGAWSGGFFGMMSMLIGVMLIVLMTHANFADTSHAIRLQLSREVAAEVVADSATRAALDSRLAGLPAQRHIIGSDAPLSQSGNMDTAFLLTARETFAPEGASSEKKAEGNALFQKFRSLYNQMMLPVALRNVLPVGVTGLFCVLMIMLMLTTDASRIFNSSSTLVQDVVVPLFKRPPSTGRHLLLLRVASVATALLFFVASLFFTNVDYINMYLTIVCAIWMGGAGSIMTFGLYSRFGNTAGAIGSLAFGTGGALLGLFCQYKWAGLIYPWLERHGQVEAVGNFLRNASAPLDPWVRWEMSAVKFPVNAYEVFAMTMISSVLAYIVCSYLWRWLTHGELFNLERMLHRGMYAVEGEGGEGGEGRRGGRRVAGSWTLRSVFGKLVGITPEYTRGDRIMAWAVVIWSLGWGWGCCFLGIVVWNAIHPWPDDWWSMKFFITSICLGMLVGVVTTVWFFIGGVRDMVALFRDLDRRVDDPLDNGVVVGRVSLADKAAFGKRVARD